MQFRSKRHVVYSAHVYSAHIRGQLNDGDKNKNGGDDGLR